jgi:flagellar hook-associated protein 1
MTHLFGVLSSGISALMTQQRAINVTGNNIANVNTPGYSRQRVNLLSGTPVYAGFGLLASGVTSTGIERIYDRFLGVQLNSESANLGRWDAQKGMLERVEVVFDETGGYGLNKAFSDFWNAWQDLSLNASGRTERSMVAATSQALADAIRKKYSDLEQVQEDITVAVEGAVDAVNQLTTQIADLNQKIALTEINGTNANDYRDSRDLVMKQLAELIDIKSFENNDGQVVVTIADGRPLVESGHTSQLRTQINSDGRMEILWPDAEGSQVDISSAIKGGKIGGYLQVRDTQIPDYQDQLDTLANEIRDEVNRLHKIGYGLKGSTGTELFTGEGAAELRINPDILADLDLIAASSTAEGVPGNAANALAIHALRTALTVNDSATFDDAANALISQVGYDVQTAKADASHQADMMTYLENYRESVSGVSLDEEMVNLVKFEAAYNAAAKMVSMADDMLNTLMDLIR